MQNYVHISVGQFFFSYPPVANSDSWGFFALEP